MGGPWGPVANSGLQGEIALQGHDRKVKNPCKDNSLSLSLVSPLGFLCEKWGSVQTWAVLEDQERLGEIRGHTTAGTCTFVGRNPCNG